MRLARAACGLNGHGRALNISAAQDTLSVEPSTRESRATAVATTVAVLPQLI